jgi:SAM-dependent methyltransferase
LTKGLAPTQRFSSRVENYVKYRPRYPHEIITILEREHGLSPASVVADVGSGTGFFAELFLEHGCVVYGVEPNREMRDAGERLLAGFPKWKSVEGSAEATTLADASVDFVTAGQAFHWFDRARTRVELARILRPGGRVVLAWNDRQLAATAFLDAYERLLQTYGTDYKLVTQAECDDDVVQGFFGGDPEMRAYKLASRQVFDRAGLRGRLLSSSYAPEEGHPNHAPMMAALDALFDEHQKDGVVAFEYETRFYCGRLPAAR